MRITILILLALVLLSGCGALYGPGEIMTAPPEAASVRAVSSAPRADEIVDVVGELEAAFAVHAPRGASLSDLVATVGAYRYEILPTSGTSYLLANHKDGAADDLGSSIDRLVELTEDVESFLAGIGETADVSAVLLNDQAPDRALAAVSGGTVIYDCRSELPDAAPGHEPAEYYVLNTSTKRIHNPWCPEIAKIDIRNRKASSEDLHTLQMEDYVKCSSAGDWDLTDPTYPPAVSIGCLLKNLPEGVTAP